MSNPRPTPGPGGGGGPPIIAIEESFFDSDLYGSTLTRGISSNRFDRAKRRGLAHRVPNDFTGMDVGVKAAMQHRGKHQSIFNLPLGYAMATRHGPDSVWVDLHYRRGRVTLPTQPERSVASFRGWHEHTLVYRQPTSFENGLPAGEIYFNPDNEPTGRAWRRPTIQIYVSTILFFVPYKNIDEAIGKVNPDSRYEMAGYRFPPKSLRLDAMDVDWIEVYDAAGNVRDAFITDYVFTFTPGGWYEQIPVSTDGVWDVETRCQFEPWRNGLRFPYQTSLGGGLSDSIRPLGT